ncbi:hypothetical protein [Salimicrobium halophilum]|uniref:Uncharacterized protein n=1 Tax=Salimicrobium halophilum TaxID=86666 RepID=A0A1G8RBX5_9BACI|nr:hypothetical protein [Salimicrobium halophilum]SDJ14458.1 hypothetical protein SAMN04490247_0944 [Salimicrobium halophilum]
MLVMIMLGSMFLGYLILQTGPFWAGIISFGIVAGCIFRGLYLLEKIYKELKDEEEASDPVPHSLENERVYKEYLRRKENN